MKGYLRLFPWAVLAAASGVVEAASIPDAPPSDESMFLSPWSGGANTLKVSSEAAAAWTLRYPTLFSSRSLGDNPWAKPLKAYEDGHLLEAMIDFDQVPEAARDADYYVYRAHFMLLTGDESEAGANLAKALAMEPNRARALALEAVLDLRKGHPEEALKQARMAVAQNPKLAAAHLALSYAQQAGRDLPAARASAEQVGRLEPDSALAYLRLAELDLASGDVARAEMRATKAAMLAPSLPDAINVLGFVQLSRNEPALAARSFEAATRLNALEPAGHFGLGLADVQLGKLEDSREQLETAAKLAPDNGLPRSYLGRLYDKLGRDREAAEQYRLASADDPNDPVPYRFDAIRLARKNTPVSAAEKLQAALDRVDNRAVYRSADLLAEDRALNLADMSALDAVLGQDDRSWLDAVQAVSAAFDSAAAHLAAGDALARLPRTGLAKDSEYLQALLRQPLGVLPPPLSLAEGIEPGAVAPQQGFFRAASPERTGYNEFGAVFNAAGPKLDLDLTGGGRNSLGDQLRAATAVGNVGLSFSQLHFETDGFGNYDSLDNTVWRGTLQYDPNPDTRLHLEYQSTDRQQMGVLFPSDPQSFQPQAIDEQRERSRFAFRHDFGEAGELIVLASRERLDQAIANLPTEFNFRVAQENDRQTVRSDVVETQYIYQRAAWRLLAGASQVREKQAYTYGAADFGTYGTFEFPPFAAAYRTTSLYGYGRYQARSDLTLEAGLAADGQVSSPSLGGQQVPGFKQHLLSPKFGLAWQALPGGTLRLAATRSLNRFFINGASLEPAQVAGFRQYYNNDSLGTRSDRVGLAWDQRLAANWDWGFEVSSRRLRLPTQGNPEPYDHWREEDSRAWLSRVLPGSLLAGVLPGWEGSLTLAYDGQDYVRHGQATGLEQIRDYRPRHLRLGGHLFDTTGWGVDMGVTWVRVRGTLTTWAGTDNNLRDSFPVADASVSWNLPRRYGQLTLGVLNLFDRRFQYLEMDPANPRFAPERYMYGRLRLTL